MEIKPQGRTTTIQAARKKFKQREMVAETGLSPAMIDKSVRMAVAGRDMRVEYADGKPVAIWEKLPTWRQLKPKSWSRRKGVKG